MAKQDENPAPETIDSTKTLEQWLRKQSSGHARVIALRIALRVFPLCFLVFDRSGSNEHRDDDDKLGRRTFARGLVETIDRVLAEQHVWLAKERAKLK